MYALHFNMESEIFTVESDPSSNEDKGLLALKRKCIDSTNISSDNIPYLLKALYGHDPGHDNGPAE